MAIIQLDEHDYEKWIHALRHQPYDEPSRILEWLEGPVKHFFHFEKVLLIHAELSMGQISITHLLSAGHSEEYISQLSKQFELADRGSLRWWLQHQQPICIDVNNPPVYATIFEIDEIKHFGFGRISAHGVVDIKSNTGTYFSFAGIPTILTNWHAEALRLITPILNDLFISYIRGQSVLSRLNQINVTSRQREIVRKLAKGFSNKRIANEMTISEKTVRNHLSEVYEKFNVKTRTELLALLL